MISVMGGHFNYSPPGAR